MNKLALPKDFPMNLRLTRTLSAITHRSGHPGRTMPPLTRGNFSSGQRWSQDAPRETLTRQALAQGTLEKFVAARSAPRTLSTGSTPHLQTNENARFPGAVQGDVPSSDANANASFAQSKAAVDAARELLKHAMRS